MAAQTASSSVSAPRPHYAKPPSHRAFRPASPVYSTAPAGYGYQQQPSMGHVLQADRGIAGSQPAYWVHSENGISAPPRVASPGSPVHTGNYRVSVRHGDEDYPQPAFTYTIPTPTARETAAPTVPGQVSLKPGDMYQIPMDRNVVFVVDEGVQLEIGDPETGQFVPYDADYIAAQKARRQTAYEETYFIPAGKVVEFRDENDRLVYRHVSSTPCWAIIRTLRTHRHRRRRRHRSRRDPHHRH
ncbi:hypothetical protein DL93DRAFT_2072172 [Clavulina sp. PMI_390]|nr:hypothetical protein DL93DRAFT_2072172 [Clavulina sp. PMI_390]